MRFKRTAVGIAAVVALAAGSAGALAATGDDREAEQTVLDAAAERLDVTPEELRSALTAAQDARLDQAVGDGELTQEQADAIKERRAQDGRVLDMGGGPGHHRGGPGGPGMFGDLAAALELSEAQLRTQLADGRSISEVAEDQDTTLPAVKRAVRAAQVDRLDAEVQAGRLTDAQRDAMVEHLDGHIDRLGEAAGGSFGGPGGRAGGMHPGEALDADDSRGGTDGASAALDRPGYTDQ